MFLEKKQKMRQNNQQISSRLAEIYQMLVNIQELGDAVIYNPDLDNNIKSVFLIWYQMKLTSLKEELDEITAIVID